MAVPIIKLYPEGETMGTGGNSAPSKHERGEVIGWTPGAVRRQTVWLYSVETEGLTGYGWAPTLTLRDCPATVEEWTRLRLTYLQALRDSGMLVRGHWVVEWQERLVPHLHMAVYLSADIGQAAAWSLFVGTWLRLTAALGSGPGGQHLAPIRDAVGWGKYLSKHAARGVAHYQRQGKPPGWDRTGRLWGHIGQWPTVDAIEARPDNPTFWRRRRLVRSWRVAQAREALKAGKGTARGLVRARRLLRCSDRRLSSVRGTSEWIPARIGLLLLEVASR